MPEIWAVKVVSLTLKHPVKCKGNFSVLLATGEKSQDKTRLKSRESRARVLEAEVREVGRIDLQIFAF